ncbi:hematopoietic prostaglandin D synthase-like [Panulirus ornatus]|uniref:hematopoietic prostaglandin D synthase-like n=1 Tax=Panulirus ornatus TaxID=150431 RepID=UPI003A89D111
MPEYKLIYFNSRGRAELTRWIFAYGGIPYTDERIEKVDWPERKKDIIGGKLPVLMVDGRTLTQSLAIARYAAKRVGLVPEDELEAAYCDALVDTVYDFLPSWRKTITSEKSEEDKIKDFNLVFYPTFLEPLMIRLDKRLREREWFISDKITWADLMIGIIFGAVKRTSGKLLDNFPSLLAHVNKLEALPKIKEWIDKRPQTVV